MWTKARVAASLTLVAGVSGACATLPRNQTPTVVQADTSSLPPPVRARLLPPFEGLLQFDVNQPVYVAIFDVRPYMAMEMLFPGPNDEGHVSAGVHGVATFYLTQANEERQALFTPRVGGGEEYLYIIASRLPLDLTPFATHPIALSAAAHVTGRALGPEAQIDSLMRYVIKPVYDEDWDADIFIVTPPIDWPMSPRRALWCPELRAEVFIPGEYPFSQCPHFDHVVSSAGRQLAAIAEFQRAMTPPVRVTVVGHTGIGPWNPIPVGNVHAWSSATGARDGGAASRVAESPVWRGNDPAAVAAARDYGGVASAAGPSSASYSGPSRGAESSAGGGGGGGGGGGVGIVGRAGRP
jgi:hypothetical protein